MMDSAYSTAERAARQSYGRLLSILIRRTGDVAAAEDALSVAFVRALETWHEQGTPDNPDAWILTVASNSMRDQLRRQRVEQSALSAIARTLAEVQCHVWEHPIKDERLAMLFMCAHPVVDVSVRTPLMLQTVLGLEVQRLASIFLISPSALAQRLVRVKAKIRDAEIWMQLPTPEEIPQRLDDVLTCVYAAFTVGSDGLGRDPRMAEVSDEAIWLGELAMEQGPQHAEAIGLCALMHLSQARKRARYGKDGSFIPLHEQDTALWDQAMIQRGEAQLRAAAKLRSPGRFQLEAAIQSVHCERLMTGVIDWRAIVYLYQRLLQVAPTLGAQCGYASALMECGDAKEALDVLELIDRSRASTYQPYWATLAAVLRRVRRQAEADQATLTAIGLSEHEAIRTWLYRTLSLGQSTSQ